jgi:hypothetical protein
MGEVSHAEEDWLRSVRGGCGDVSGGSGVYRDLRAPKLFRWGGSEGCPPRGQLLQGDASTSQRSVLSPTGYPTHKPNGNGTDDQGPKWSRSIRLGV